MPDRLERAAGSSALDGLDHLAGFIALITTAMIGVELYRWLALGRPVDNTMLWILPTAAGFWRRAIVGEEAGRHWPASWFGWVGAYFVVVLAIELIRKPATWGDWGVVLMTVLFIGLSIRKVVRG